MSDLWWRGATFGASSMMCAVAAAQHRWGWVLTMAAVALLSQYRSND